MVAAGEIRNCVRRPARRLALRVRREARLSDATTSCPGLQPGIRSFALPDGEGRPFRAGCDRRPASSAGPSRGRDAARRGAVAPERRGNLGCDENGAPLIASGVLRDPERRTFASRICLFRSRRLASSCPDAFIRRSTRASVAAMRHRPHYRSSTSILDASPLEGRWPRRGLARRHDAGWDLQRSLGGSRLHPTCFVTSPDAPRQGALRTVAGRSSRRVPREAFVRSRDEKPRCRVAGTDRLGEAPA